MFIIFLFGLFLCFGSKFELMDGLSHYNCRNSLFVGFFEKQTVFFFFSMRNVEILVDWCYYVSIRIIEICQRLPLASILLYFQIVFHFVFQFFQKRHFSIFAFDTKRHHIISYMLYVVVFPAFNVANHSFRVTIK